MRQWIKDFEKVNKNLSGTPLNVFAVNRDSAIDFLEKVKIELQSNLPTPAWVYKFSALGYEWEVRPYSADREEVGNIHITRTYEDVLTFNGALYTLGSAEIATNRPDYVSVSINPRPQWDNNGRQRYST